MKTLISLTVVLIVWFAASANAQTFPSKPMNLVVGFAPGGTVDITARILSTSLNTQFGQAAIVNNRPGAEGVLGGDFVAKSAPDGYTVLIVPTSTFTLAPATKANLPYDPVKDFAAIGMLNNVPYVVVTGMKTSIPNLNIRELTAFAKGRPGQVTMAYGGTGAQFAIELMSSMSGTKLLPVPYKGAGQALADVIGGQVDSFMSALPGVVSSIRDGKMKGLAITTQKRSSLLPDVPTMDESGFKGYEATTITGVLAPAGTSPAVINALNAAITKAVRSTTVKESFLKLGAEPQDSTPAQFSAYILSDIEKWKKVAESLGIKPE